MSVLEILAIIFLAMSIGGLLILYFLAILFYDFITGSDKVSFAFKVIGNALVSIFFIGIGGLVVTGIVAMCLYC